MPWRFPARRPAPPSASPASLSFPNKRSQGPGDFSFVLPTTTTPHGHPTQERPPGAARRVRQPVRAARAHRAGREGPRYERAEQDIFAKSELLLRSNPVHAKVPVLLHAGRGPVCESLTILQYLDDAFPEGRLLPLDPYARAGARFWAEFSDRAHSCGKRLWMTRDGETEEEARAEMLRVLGALDAELGEKEFFGGGEGEESFGYVDIAAAPFAAWFAVYERYGGFSVAEECPRLASWAARCARRESVAANVYAPEKVCELVEMYKQRVLSVGVAEQQQTR